MQSKRFVIVSFFATLTLSAVCQGIFGVISTASCSGWTTLLVLNAIYAVAYASFLIKYYIDDVIDDNGGISECVSRFSLARLIIAWMFFLIAALFVCELKASLLSWLIGTVIVTWFLIANSDGDIERRMFYRYLFENIIILFFVTMALGGTILNYQMCMWIGFCGVCAITSVAFCVMLLDKTPTRGTSCESTERKEV